MRGNHHLLAAANLGFLGGLPISDHWQNSYHDHYRHWHQTSGGDTGGTTSGTGGTTSGTGDTTGGTGGTASGTGGTTGGTGGTTSGTGDTTGGTGGTTGGTGGTTGGTGDTTGGTGGTTPTSSALTYSTTPIHTTQDGQVIQNLDLYVNSGDAITVTNNNVVIENVRIHYNGDSNGAAWGGGASGILINGAQNVTIQHVEVDNTAPPSGSNPASKINYDIYGINAPNLHINDATVKDGSTGVWLGNSPGATFTNIDGYNFHGPMPRGQFIQLDHSDSATINGFYAYDGLNSSYTEDNISVFYSKNVQISNGLIDGNNSPNGVGVMFEGTSQGGTVSHVDAVHMSNGAFSAYSNNITFDYTRSFDNTNVEGGGRGTPSSNALIWNVSGDGSSTGVSLLHSTYTHPANPGNIVWNPSTAVAVDVHQDANAVPMDDPVVHHFEWN